MHEVNIKRHLEELSLKELSQRRESLSNILLSEHINFKREEQNGIVNFIFSSEVYKSGNSTDFLFSAHYDNYRSSYGANDNMSSVCILIDLYHALTARKIHADFLLTDGEEDNHSGAEFFSRTHDLKRYSGIINLDLCGYGDVIVLRGNVRKFTARNLLKRHNAELVKYLPESDDVIFRKAHVPVISVSIVPKWDVQYLRALAAFGEGLLGRPPEFYMIQSDMEVTQTFHNNAKDSPEYVDEHAMMKVYDYLLEAMTNEEKDSGFSFMRLFWRQ